MKRKIIVLILCVALCMQVLAVQALADSGTAVFAVSGASGNPGQTIDVAINMVGNPGIMSVQLDVQYDSSVLTLKKVSDGGIIGTQYHSDNLSLNPYRLTWANDLATENFTATGRIVTLTFEISSSAKAGTSSINICDSEIYDCDLNWIEYSSSAGTITVTIPSCATHTWDAGTVIQSQGCETDELTQYTCTVCGETKTESTKKATGHSWDEGKVTTEPGCETEGVKTFTCKNDPTHTKTEPVPAAGHKWGEWKVTTPAACEKKGTQTRTCDLCGETESKTNIPALGHDFGDWVKVDDNNHQRTCKRTGCDKTETAAHAWDKVDHKDPTCKDDGYDRFQCPDCNAVKTTYIKSTGDHGFNTWTDNGDGKTHTSVCDGCGLEKKTEDHTWDKEEITTKPTCSKEGVKTFTCKCGATKTEKIPVTGEHTYENGKWEKNDAETHKMKCDHCDTYKTEKHNWDKGVVTEQPTCSKEGVKVYTCKDCKQTKKEVLPATGEHDYTAKYEKVDEKTHKAFCACGEGIEEEHKKSTFIKVIRKPTTSEKGLELWACVCGHEMEIETPAISGNYDKVPKTGDITGQVILLCISAVAVMAGAVYGIKRKATRQK